MSASAVRVGVMGATGMVGTEMLRILEERAFPVSELRAYASVRSEGRKLGFGGSPGAGPGMRTRPWRRRFSRPGKGGWR